MIYSMTAYAQCDTDGDWGRASCEIRSLNHRYLDVSLYLSETLRELEMKLRESAKILFRGKVECQLKFFPAEGSAENFTFNYRLAEELAHKAQLLREMVGQNAKVEVVDLLSWPDVLQPIGVNLAPMHPIILNLFEQTITKLIAIRAREGNILSRFIKEKLEKIEQVVNRIKRRAPEVLVAQRQKLRERLNLVKAELDAIRLEQEMVLFAQKLDISEELDRLTTHIIETRRLLTQGGVVGRQLDFLMQEFNREANTLASKFCDSETTKHVVELKVLIEQIREQVQNIV